MKTHPFLGCYYGRRPAMLFYIYIYIHTSLRGCAKRLLYKDFVIDISLCVYKMLDYCESVRFLDEAIVPWTFQTLTPLIRCGVRGSDPLSWDEFENVRGEIRISAGGGSSLASKLSAMNHSVRCVRVHRSCSGCIYEPIRNRYAMALAL